MSVDQALMASVHNSLLIIQWQLGGGKGKKPKLIEFSGGKSKDEHYGVAVSTEKLIKYMGDHIPKPTKPNGGE